MFWTALSLCESCEFFAGSNKWFSRSPQLDHLFLAFLGISVFGEKMVIVFVAGCLSLTNLFVLLLFLSLLMKYFASLLVYNHQTLHVVQFSSESLSMRDRGGQKTFLPPFLSKIPVQLLHYPASLPWISRYRRRGNAAVSWQSWKPIWRVVLELAKLPVDSWLNMDRFITAVFPAIPSWHLAGICCC